MAEFSPHNSQYVTFKIILPAIYNKPPDPSQFYLLCEKLLANYLPRKKPVIILECIASYSDGNLFLVSVPYALSQQIRNLLISYWPRLEIEQVTERQHYASSKYSRYRVRAWRPERRYFTAGILKSWLSIGNNLKKNEAIGWQVIVASQKTSTTIDILSVVYKIFRWFLSVIWGITLLFLTDPVKSRQYKINRTLKIGRTKSPALNILVSLRSFTLSSTPDRLSSLDLACVATLKAHGNQAKIVSRQNMEMFIFKKPGRKYKLSTDELKMLFEFPESGSWQDKSIQSFSTELQPNIKRKSLKPDVVLGVYAQGEDVCDIALSRIERQKHTLIVGGTGMGKSTLLGHSFIQDISVGLGATLIDPHGELAKLILRCVPKNRVSDVVYINPVDISYPIAINLLQLPENLDDEEFEIAKDFVCEAIVSIFRKIFSEDGTGGHRIEYILRNSIQTALTVPNANIFTIHKLLTNDIYRASVVSNLRDQSLRDFWHGEFNKAGSYQRVKMMSGVTAKLGRFARSASAKRMLECPRSSIDFEDILENRKILICNLSKGGIGEDTSNLLGQVILAKLQLAAWKRSLKSVKNQAPYSLYVDEFASFSGSIFSQLISESRKFGLMLTLAEQTTAFQNESESNILLSNVGNVLCFRTAAAIDARRLAPIFEPRLSSYDLANLAPYQFYLKSSGEFAQHPMSGKTINLPTGRADIMKLVVDTSRRHYSVKYVSKTNDFDRKIPYKSPTIGNV